MADRFPGSRGPSHYNGPSAFPPLDTFTGSIDERIQKAREWREQNLPQQQSSPASAASQNQSPARHSFTHQSPRNAPSQHTPRRASRNEADQTPSRPAPQNNSSYHASHNASPHRPFHQNSSHHSPVPVAHAAPAVPWQPNLSQSSPPGYHHQYHQPQPTASLHSHSYRQPTAPGYHHYHTVQSNANAYDHPSRYAAQPTATGYYQQHAAQQNLHGHPQPYSAHPLVAGYHQQAYAPQPNPYGYQTPCPAQPTETRHQQQHTPQSNVRAPLQRHLSLSFEQYQRPPAVAPSTPSHPDPHQLVYGHPASQSSDSSTVPSNAAPTLAADSQAAAASEDEDWEAFEAEVIRNAPTIESAAAVARNFARVATSQPASCRPTISQLAPTADSATAVALDYALPAASQPESAGPTTSPAAQHSAAEANPVGDFVAGASENDPIEIDCPPASANSPFEHTSITSPVAGSLTTASPAIDTLSSATSVVDSVQSGLVAFGSLKVNDTEEQADEMDTDSM